MNLKTCCFYTIILFSTTNFSSAFCQSIEKQVLHTQPAKMLSKKLKLNEQKCSFSYLLRRISDQTGASFVCDDVSHVKEASFVFNGELKDTLDKLGKTFDYRWELSKAGMILMRKSFNQIDNYPSCNLPELQRTARELLSLMGDVSSFSDKAQSSDACITVLMNSLSPAQVAYLKEGNYIRSTSLNASQFSQIEVCGKSILCYNLTSQIADIENTISYLPKMSMYYYKWVEQNSTWAVPEMMMLEACYPKYTHRPITSSLLLRVIPINPKEERGYKDAEGNMLEVKKKP